jgi:hypothetical protein
MSWRTHDIDGSKVYLGFDQGAIAKMTLPERVRSYASEEPHFPEFTGRFAPPQGAELIAAVCWNSLYFDSLDAKPKGFARFCDVRHAYFLGQSATVRWTWLLFMLGYDHDNETWEWCVVSATDREFEDRRSAARWLLEGFWYWHADRIGRHASRIAKIGATGLLSIDDIQEMCQRIFPTEDYDPK